MKHSEKRPGSRKSNPNVEVVAPVGPLVLHVIDQPADEVDAETASLVGASLQRAPDRQPGPAAAQDLFAFPGIRDWLSFTAEPAFAASTSLVVGFAALRSAGAKLQLLKPLVRSGELTGHFHAAAFPYRPLRKGRLGLTETIQSLFEAEHVLGLLHLVNDWRETSGVGQSRLLRGACWCAPLTC